MGAANVVPGVSGGTIALLTGIYSDIVSSLNSVTDKKTWDALLHWRLKEFWQLIGGNFLLALGAGIAVSIISLAKLMTFVLETWPAYTWAFFFGLILASVWFMIRDRKDWKLSSFVAIAAGFGLGLAISLLSPANTPDDWWFLFIVGAVSVCTMILPGVSGSFVMVIFGKYDYIMNAIGEINVPVLLIFAFGCVVGLLAFAKLLHWLLARWENQTMLVLIGFVLGTLIKVWPWNETDHVVVPEIPGALVCCVAGGALVVALELTSKKKEK